MALIEGTSDDDSLVGTADNDTIYGFHGNDTLDGLGGNDRIFGGDGNDLIRTGNGRDRARGEAGNDTLRGGTGNHTLYGGGGDDWVLLGADGSYWGDYDPPQHRVGYGGSGDDLLQATGRHHADLFGGSGTDTARLILYSATASTMRVQLGGPGAGLTSDTGQTMVFDSIERLQVFADFGDQTVIGGDLDDQIYVGAGSDRVEAGGGDDTVGIRLSGSHTLEGGAGDDLLVAEGIGDQSVYFIVQADGSVDDGNLSRIHGFERYHAFGQGRADDIISLGRGDDTAEGFAGNDTVFGMSGDDWLNGGAGDDLIHGGDGDDRIHGGSGADLLYGGDGNDTIGGGSGANTLYGGTGDDRFFTSIGPMTSTIYGGSGADSFVLGKALWQPGLVMDFETGTDRIVIKPGVLAGFVGQTGQQGAGMLVYGAANQPGGQFVLTMDAAADRSSLWWDRDGSAGALPLQHLLQVDGAAVAIAPGDLFVV